MVTLIQHKSVNVWRLKTYRCLCARILSMIGTQSADLISGADVTNIALEHVYRCDGQVFERGPWADIVFVNGTLKNHCPKLWLVPFFTCVKVNMALIAPERSFEIVFSGGFLSKQAPATSWDQDNHPYLSSPVSLYYLEHIIYLRVLGWIYSQANSTGKKTGWGSQTLSGCQLSGAETKRRLILGLSVT